MPNCFKLISKKTKETADLPKVDEEICKVLGVPVHPKQWGGGYNNEDSFDWYILIGLPIATGKELGSQELKDSLKKNLSEFGWNLAQKVLTYLEENYTSDAWYSPY